MNLPCMYLPLTSTTAMVRSRIAAFIILLVVAISALLFFLVDFQLPFKAQVTLNPTALKSTNTLPPPEAYILSFSDSLVEKDIPITFIPYTFGFEMLVQTLQVYKRASWRNIVVLDNSWAKDAWVERETLKELGVVKVVLTSTHLRFAQMMSTVDTLARTLGLEYYLWTHSDVFLISPSLEPSPFEIVTTCVAAHISSIPKLGVLFFHYDWLSMVRVKAATAVPWDPSIMQYGSDCDRYNRLRHANFLVVDASTAKCPSLGNLGHFENMRGPLSSADLSVVLSTKESFEKRLQTIVNAINETQPYSWTSNGRGGMTLLDHEAKYAAEVGGKWYWEKKWGKKWGTGDCQQTLEDKKFDVPPIDI
ncbi:hypothetical protein DL96DRAFT_1686320 [Flagelloscypha sp. PMI_526]|nr:hypothetical protein DL96DRAFT_1686320 [Flagelloscypha sp. PMI_526]